MDPCLALPALPFHEVLGNLDARSLAACSTLSRGWKAAAYSNDLWDALCKELWAHKEYVPKELRSLPDRRAAWVRSMGDAKREEITEEELCGFTWNFAFKQGRTPFHNTVLGRYAPRPLRRYFHTDHTLGAPKDDPLEGGDYPHEPYSWAFRTMEGPDGEQLTMRQYVQVSQFPYLHLSRTPGWGWRMENMWVVLTSDHKAGPNPGRGKEGATGADVLMAWFQLVGLGLGEDEEDEEEEEEDEEEDTDEEAHDGLSQEEENGDEDFEEEEEEEESDEMDTSDGERR